MHKILAIAGLCILAAGCAGRQDKVSAPAAAPSPDQVLTDVKPIAEAQRALTALGYASGPADGHIGPRTDKAVRAYQKDEKLAADGRLTAPLADRLKTQRTKLPRGAWTPRETGLTLLFGEGPAATLESAGKGTLIWRMADGSRAVRSANFLILSEPGTSADAPMNFLQPLHPGRSGQYRLRRGDRTVTVSCAVGHLGRTAVPAGVFDTIEAVCREDGNPAIEHRYAYAPALKLVIREETKAGDQEAKLRELVALRPPTESWPRAAQAGLDWALSHALESPAETEPLRWSSTGVKERYAIKVDRSAAMALPGGGRCLRYEIERTDMPARYPGLACRSETGAWAIPSAEPTPIAHPSLGLSPQATADTKMAR